MTMYASEEDLKIINEHFEPTGRAYTQEDNIAVHYTAYEVALYLYKDDTKRLLADLIRFYPNDGNDNLLQNLVDESHQVIQAENGIYYTIGG